MIYIYDDIGVYNTADRTNELTYSYDKGTGAGGKGDLYLNFLFDTVLPWASSRYRIGVTRDMIGIAGSSLGGLISCYGAWTRPIHVGRAVCMSSSFWWNGTLYITNPAIIYRYYIYVLYANDMI